MKALESTFGRISMRLFASLIIVLYTTLSFLPLIASAQTIGSGSLTASPTSGTAPLPVTFTATWLDVSKTYTITYGDGNVSAPLSPQCATDNTSSQSTGCIVKVTHTYVKAGSFTPTTAGYTAHVSVSAAPTASATTKPTCQITLNTSSISIGGSVTVKWTSTNATAGAITNIGNVGPTGSINLLPSSAAVTTYFGAFTGPGGTSNCQASVAVNSTGSGSGSNGAGTTDTSGTVVQTTPTATAAPTPLPTGQSSGLVPCGYGAFTGGNESSSSTGCQACSLGQLIQNIMTFAIGIAIPIAAALFAYAGFLYITSASNPANIGKAKKIFQDALIGFLIAITAWLIINTLLHVIFSQGTFSGGNWFTIQCDTNNRPVNNKITDVLSSLPIVAGNTGALQPDGSGGSGGGVDTTGAPTVGNGSGATSGSSYNNTLDTLSTLCDTNGDTASCNAANEFADTGKLSTAVQNVLSDACDDGVSATSCSILNSSSYSSGKTVNPQMAAQLSAACAQYNLTDCTFAQSIARNESSGGNNCTTSYTGAAGCMQVLATTACTTDSSISSDCSSCLASHNSTSAACAPVIQTIINNPQMGTNLGVQYISQLQNMPALQSLQQQYGTCQITAAAYYQGPGNVLKSGGVPANAVSYVNHACN